MENWIGFRASGDTREDIVLTNSLVEAVCNISTQDNAEHFLSINLDGRIITRKVNSRVSRISYELMNRIANRYRISGCQCIEELDQAIEEFKAFRAGWMQYYSCSQIYQTALKWHHRGDRIIAERDGLEFHGQKDPEMLYGYIEYLLSEKSGQQAEGIRRYAWAVNPAYVHRQYDDEERKAFELIVIDAVADLFEFKYRSVRPMMLEKAGLA